MWMLGMPCPDRRCLGGLNDVDAGQLVLRAFKPHPVHLPCVNRKCANRARLLEFFLPIERDLGFCAFTQGSRRVRG